MGRLDPRRARAPARARPAGGDRSRRRDHRRPRELQPTVGRRVSRRRVPRRAQCLARRRRVGAAAQLVRDGCRRPRRARRGAVLNPLLPNYRGRELHHILATARTKLLFTPDELRGFDHAALGRELHDSIDTLDGHVVVRGGGDFWQHVLGRKPAHLDPVTDAAALSEVIFTSGTEATPKGVMHTEHTTNCNVRSALRGQRPHSPRCGVGTEPDRPLHRPELRGATGALLRAEAGAPGPLGRRPCRRAHRTGAVLLHARCDHVSHRSRHRGRALRPRRVVTHALRLRWGTCPTGDRPRGSRRGDQRAAHLRAHRSAGGELEPRRLSPRQAHAHRRPSPAGGRARDRRRRDHGPRPQRVRRPVRRRGA